MAYVVGKKAPVPVVYDWRRTALSALKVGALSAAGVVVADQAGLTEYLLAHLPAGYAAIGGVLIASAFAAVRNWLANRNRDLRALEG